MINLLEHFALSHTQVTHLHAELKEMVPDDQKFNAKVELKLTPREMAPTTDERGMPVYQVTARLICRGFKSQDEKTEPLFAVELVLQAAYKQVSGNAVSYEDFTRNHTSLTRQLYPIIHHQLQPILKQFGLDQVRLPYDLLNPPKQKGAAGRQVH